MSSYLKIRKNIEYLDISVAFINAFILVFAAIVVPRNIILITLNLTFITILCGLLLLTFLKKNPYYISPGYGMVIFGLVLSFGLLTLPEFYTSLLWIGFLIIGILDIIYVAGLIKGSASSMSRLGVSSGRVWKLVEPGTNTPTYIKGGNINLKQRKELQKKYHMSWILLVTAISFSIIFITLII